MRRLVGLQELAAPMVLVIVAALLGTAVSLSTQSMVPCVCFPKIRR